MLELFQGKIGVNFHLDHCIHIHIGHGQVKLFNKEETMQVWFFQLFLSNWSQKAKTNNNDNKSTPYFWKPGFHKLRENPPDVTQSDNFN